MTEKPTKPAYDDGDEENIFLFIPNLIGTATCANCFYSRLTTSP